MVFNFNSKEEGSEELQKTQTSGYLEALEALVMAIDLRHADTQAHSRRVAKYSIRLAKEMGLDEKELSDLSSGVLLHDIGKIGIPDRVLMKPAKLTDDERKEVEKHTIYGYKIVGEVGFLSGAKSIVLHHHERYDGTGYPKGLAKDKIPIGARIFAVIDAYDAITSDRPYRKGSCYEAAKAELLKGSGTQFDPEVVAAFLRIPRSEWEEFRAEAEVEVASKMVINAKTFTSLLHPFLYSSLNINKQLYKNIINSLPYALLVLDEELRVIYCNQRCETLLSKAEKEILGRNLSEVVVHKELQSHVQSVLQNGGIKLVEIHFESERPKILKAVITASARSKQAERPERSERSERKGKNLCLVTLEDIIERDRLEGQFVQSEDLSRRDLLTTNGDFIPLWRSLLQAKLAGIGLLATNVVHELGNPLGVISSTLQYVRDTLSKSNTDNPQIVEALETVMDSIGQMHEILRGLSELSSSQSPRFEPTDLRHLIFQMLGFIHKEARRHNIKIYHRFEENLPDCEIAPREMKQLLLNLLKNAIEAMPNGGKLQVKAHRLKGKEENQEVCIDISDSGHGIRKNELRSIFKPFYSTKPNGTGLGLPFCRRVVEEHGGEIRVKSKWDTGSTFSVILPVRQDREGMRDDADE